MIAAVYDCMIFVQAALSSRGPAFACLALVEDKQVVLYTCPEILDEIAGTLNRSSLRRKYTTLTDERVASFLHRVANISTLLDNPPRVFSLPRDPKDGPYLNLAIAARTPFIVSRDKDLLALMDDDEFRRTYPTVTIVEPVSFLTHVRTQASDVGCQQ